MKIKKKINFDLNKICCDDLVYPTGAVPYQGADDVFICLLALSMVVQTVDKLPKKKQTSFLCWLSDRSMYLLSKNSEFMVKMEELHNND